MRRRPDSPGAIRRGLAVLVATCLATAGLLGTGTSVAQAHDELLDSIPAAGATLDTAPAQIELELSEDVQPLGTEVVVTADDGTTASDGPVGIDGTTVVQPLTADLPAGFYTVDWRVTSADGHPLSDRFTFTVADGTTDVGEAAAVTPPESSSGGTWIAVGAAAVLLVAVLVTVRSLRRRS